MNWLKKLFGKQKPASVTHIDPVNKFMEEMTAIKEAGSENGKHYTDNIELIKQLKRDKKYNEAAGILLKAIELTENESKKASAQPVNNDQYAFLSAGRTSTWGVAPWYYEQLAIIYRKQKRYAEEVSILERYAAQPKAPGVGPKKLAERLIKPESYWWITMHNKALQPTQKPLRVFRATKFVRYTSKREDLS